MKLLRVFVVCFVCAFGSLHAQSNSAPAETPPAQNTSAPANSNATPPSSSSATSAQDDEQHRNTTAAAAATAQAQQASTRPPSLLEHIVDSILERFDLDTSHNTTTRYVIAACFILAAFVVRMIVRFLIDKVAKHFTARTKTTLDDKLLAAVDRPVAVFIMLIGVVGALKILKLSDQNHDAINYGATLAFSLVVFWLLLRAFSALLNHWEEVARGRQSSIAAFMPWIKKTAVTIFVVFGLLMVAQSLGVNVKAFLATLGIGGLAFALAAQDTLANLFGSVVVAIDQPFKIGEFVQIGANAGAVEDIGLRSTKLRRVDRSLLVIPNKTVASEVIVNLSRFTQRRMEQNLSLTYDSKPADVEGLVADIQKILTSEPEIDKTSVMVNFSDFTESALNIWIVYQSFSPDWGKFIALRQRMNVKFIQAVAGRGLRFAFPRRMLEFDGDVARRLAEDVGRKDAQK